MPPPSDNVWVGDVPIGIDNETLKAIFEPYGEVVSCRVLPAKSEDTKPAGLIRFASVEIASWVCDNLNGNVPEGLFEPVIVRFANAPGSYTPGGSKGDGKGDGGKSHRSEPYPGGGKGGGEVRHVDPPPESDNVWVGDLPIGCDQNHLPEIFEPYGQIVSCRMLPGRDENSKPCALIRFASVEMAKWVVESLNAQIPAGLEEPIICRFANAPKTKGAGSKGKVGTDASPFQAGTIILPAWQAGKGLQPKGGLQGGPAADAGKGKKGGPAPLEFELLFQAVKESGLLGGTEKPEPECCVYIKGLPADTTDHDLYRLFSPFGGIPPNGVKAMVSPDGSCKGFGFVDFVDPAAAQAAALSLEGFTLPDGSSISASLKKPPTSGKSKGKGKGK